MSGTSVKPLHILILGDLGPGEELTRWIDSHARVEHVDTFEAALEALRTEPYDIIISRATDFVPFKGVHFTRQGEAIIDSVSQGVCIVDQHGGLEWANPKMLSFPDAVRAHILRCCTETFDWAQTEVETGSSQIRGRRFSFTTDDNEYCEVSATPVIDLHNRITQVVAVVWNTTNVRRLQEKLDAIDRAGRELLSLDVQQFARLDSQQRLSLLEQKIIRCTKELLRFDNFEIRVLNKGNNQLDLVLTSGLPSDIPDVDLFASTEGNGISGYVAATGRSYICPDVRGDSRYLPGVKGALSSLTVPLYLQDKVVAVANFESAALSKFNEDDRQFAEIFAHYIALALHMLELLVTERQATTGRLGSDVMAEITAPLNDILTETESLVEDYIGHDDLRHRLRLISENAVRIRESIKEITSPRVGIVGTRSIRSKRKDPLFDGKRVLIADDEDTIRETVRDVLVGYGCEVQTAVDGSVAIDLIADHPFDLVLSDIKMPGKNGYEVFAAAKEANSDTPVILTTGFGYDPNHSIIRARREGLAAVLFKPFKVDQLLNEIRMALKSASPEETG